MKTIITIQHPQSVHHVNGMVGSWVDWPLTDFGKDQAKRIAANLRRELGSIKPVIYTSDLLRASQTAEIIAAPYHAVPIARKELRERNLGKACGQSVQWLRDHLECQEKTVDDRLFSDAESRRDAWQRLIPFYQEIMANAKDVVVIVSHGDLLSLFNAMFIGLTPEALAHFDAFGMAGGVSRMFVNDEGKHIIKKLSDMSYLA